MHFGSSRTRTSTVRCRWIGFTLTTEANLVTICGLNSRRPLSASGAVQCPKSKKSKFVLEHPKYMLTTLQMSASIRCHDGVGSIILRKPFLFRTQMAKNMKIYPRYVVTLSNKSLYNGVLIHVDHRICLPWCSYPWAVQRRLPSPMLFTSIYWVWFVCSIWGAHDAHTCCRTGGAIYIEYINSGKFYVFSHICSNSCTW